MAYNGVVNLSLLYFVSDFEYPNLPHHQNVQPSFSLICGFDPEGTMNEVRASKRGKILEANEKWLVNAHNTN